MFHPVTDLWTLFRRSWLDAEAPRDPRLAADAGVQASFLPRMISPLVGAYLH